MACSEVPCHVKFARVLSERTDTAIVPRNHDVRVETRRSILNQAQIDSVYWDKLQNKPSIHLAG